MVNFVVGCIVVFRAVVFIVLGPVVDCVVVVVGVLDFVGLVTDCTGVRILVVGSVVDCSVVSVAVVGSVVD